MFSQKKNIFGQIQAKPINGANKQERKNGNTGTRICYQNSLIKFQLIKINE